MTLPSSVHTPAPNFISHGREEQLDLPPDQRTGWMKNPAAMTTHEELSALEQQERLAALTNAGKSAEQKIRSLCGAGGGGSLGQASSPEDAIQAVRAISIVVAPPGAEKLFHRCSTLKESQINTLCELAIARKDALEGHDNAIIERDKISEERNAVLSRIEAIKRSQPDLITEQNHPEINSLRKDIEDYEEMLDEHKGDITFYAKEAAKAAEQIALALHELLHSGERPPSVSSLRPFMRYGQSHPLYPEYKFSYRMEIYAQGNLEPAHEGAQNYPGARLATVTDTCQ